MPGDPVGDLHLIQEGGVELPLVTLCTETGDKHWPLQGSRAACLEQPVKRCDLHSPSVCLAEVMKISK